MAPDAVDAATAAWAGRTADRARALVPSPALLASLRAHTLAVPAAGTPLGVLARPEGRAFVHGLWAADLAAYPRPADRVDWPRLAWVVDLFPTGFTLYTVEAPEGERVPVGYAGWYPVDRDTVRWLVRRPGALRHRGQIVPLRAVGPGDALYVFNYSMVAPLHHTGATRVLLTGLAAALDAHPGHPRLALTVSPEGARVATRLGMSPRARVEVDGEEEVVQVGPGRGGGALRGRARGRP